MAASIWVVTVLFVFLDATGATHLGSHTAPIANSDACDPSALVMMVNDLKASAKQHPDWKVIDYGYGCGEIGLEGHAPGDGPDEDAAPAETKHIPGKNEAEMGSGPSGGIRPGV